MDAINDEIKYGIMPTEGSGGYVPLGKRIHHLAELRKEKIRRFKVIIDECLWNICMCGKDTCFSYRHGDIMKFINLWYFEEDSEIYKKIKEIHNTEEFSNYVVNELFASELKPISAKEFNELCLELVNDNSISAAWFSGKLGTLCNGWNPSTDCCHDLIHIYTDIYLEQLSNEINGLSEIISKYKSIDDKIKEELSIGHVNGIDIGCKVDVDRIKKMAYDELSIDKDK